MKEYKMPEMKLVKFSTEDIITDSAASILAAGVGSDVYVETESYSELFK